MAQQHFKSRKLERIRTALHEHSPLATVLQTLVASYLKGPTTLLVADMENHIIRAVSLEDGSVRTIAGQPKKSGHLDGKSALFYYPHALAVHKPSNSLFVGEWGGCCIRCVSLNDFTVSTLCGRPGERGGGSVKGIGGLAILGSDLIVCGTPNNYIRRVPLDVGGPSLVAGAPGQRGYVDGRGSEAKFDWPRALEEDSAGNLFVADSSNNRIRKIDFSGVVSTVAGCGTGGHKDGPAMEALFHLPEGLTFNNEGNLLVCDTYNHCLRLVNLEMGTVSTVAGQPGQEGPLDGSASEAKFWCPREIVVDPATGDMYVSCSENCTIRKVSNEGIVTTVCGQPGVEGFADGTKSKFDFPSGLALV